MTIDIKETLRGIYHNPRLRRSVIPLFLGNCGLGKTSEIQEFAKEVGVKLEPMLASTASPYDIGGAPMPDKRKKVFTYFNYDKLQNLKDGDILFLDEITTAPEATLNAALTVLHNRQLLTGHNLANVMIVAAGNPQGMPEYSAQIKNRFMWMDVKYDHVKWCKWMEDNYGMPIQVSTKLSKLIQVETFTGYNFYTPRSVCKAVDMIIGGVYSEYTPTVKPILETVIINDNELEQDVQLKNGIWKYGEGLPWLDIIKSEYGTFIK